MNTIFSTGFLGFLTSWIGIFIGMTSSYFIEGRGRRFKGTVLGFIGGFMLSIVCFDLLPESFEVSNIYIAMLGVVFGLVLAVMLDGKLEHNHIHDYSNKKRQAFLKAAVLMAISVGIHNIPSGVALGSLFATSSTEGIHLAIALILHGIPEGLTIGIFLRESRANRFSFILISILTSIPMSLGSILGSVISQVSPIVISISLAIASGMILYITFRETIPTACDTWRGRMSTVGNVLGMTIGILMVSLLH